MPILFNMNCIIWGKDNKKSLKEIALSQKNTPNLINIGRMILVTMIILCAKDEAEGLVELDEQDEQDE